ncbi:MAG: hypothetical protein HUU26_01490 [Gemmatimonadaceae bacterium]|nr:hypothetical protein [Phycisphaerae bacterium]NUQ10985.1 hypothetical protein [Gemmatimonadaceae bacterium]
MSDAPHPPSLWQMLRDGRVGFGTRLTLSLVSGLVLVAAAMCAAWLIAAGFSPRQTYGSAPTFYFRVTDDQVFFCLGAAGLIWLATLTALWGGFEQRRYLTRAVLGTIGIVVVCTFVGVAIDEVVRSEEEFLIAGVVLIGAAGVVMLWLSAVHKARRHRAVVGADDLVNVFCPECGYSMIGLHEPRCPECGATFTLDELIRRQNYAAHERPLIDAAARLMGIQRGPAVRIEPPARAADAAEKRAS